MTKKKKIEVKTVEDIKKLEKEEQAKWEIAAELGLFDKVTSSGWKSLTSRESGRIGGILAARNKKENKKTCGCLEIKYYTNYMALAIPRFYHPESILQTWICTYCAWADTQWVYNSPQTTAFC